MRICVYAIAKDESQFVDRWMDSMVEADWVCVLDTGSTDDTVQKLAERGAIVRQEAIIPWRFDEARNRSMDLIPPEADVCVCTDLDEVFRPGWREALEAAWQPETEQGEYQYTWNFTPDGAPGTAFWYEKIHKPGVFRWKHPVHEVLERTDGKTAWVKTRLPGVALEHHADPAKSRAQYLPLLELAVEEEPENDRNMHYLGREYMFRGQWETAIQTLERHLDLKTATWKDERCASMRFLSLCYERLGQMDEAERWARRAAHEAPWLREGWARLQWVAYQNGQWSRAVKAGERALAIQERPESYINELSAWDGTVEDVQSVSLWQSGRKVEALDMAKRAMERQPENRRIRENVQIMKMEVKK